ncbi:MAG: hypothetical protein IJ651_08115 [Bacteroidales bacterium]|nr:hypothetical protein [Bacteroidales bacterium]
MKRSVMLAAVLTLAVSCSPAIYTHYLDVRKPSDMGLDFSGKSMAMVYMENASGADSLFNRSVASSFARTLEEDYFGEEEVIGLYKIPYADSLSLETMRSLVMDTGEDVVFLVTSTLGEVALEENTVIQNARSVDSAYVRPAQVPLFTSLFIYDSLGEDKVYRYTGSTVLRPMLYNNGLTPDENLKALARKVVSDREGEMIGERISRRFLSNWQTEGFSFYYFDGFNSDVWESPLEHCLNGEFAKAIDGWIPLVQGGNPLRQACASYNIALTFFLLDDMSLATRWLDQADALYGDLVLSDGLRKRIESKMKRQ